MGIQDRRTHQERPLRPGGPRARDPFPLPYIRLRRVQLRSSRSRRVLARAGRLRRAVEAANNIISTLNSMYSGPPKRPAGGASPPAGVPQPLGARALEAQDHIFRQALLYCSPPRSAATSPAGFSNCTEIFDSYTPASGGTASAVPVQAALLSLPLRGGTFPTGWYVGPDLLNYLDAEESSLASPIVAELAASLTRSFQGADREEYVKTVARMLGCGMVELTAEAVSYPLGIFAVLKADGISQRMIVDGRPANCFFSVPPIEHTSGEDLARMHVSADHVLEAAKADLADYFHSCALNCGARRYLGLRPVSARELLALGAPVPEECIDAAGNTHPRLTTVPMGWGPAPALAQGAHEAILHGSLGSGSALARSLPPTLDPEARWSSVRSPVFGTNAYCTPHALVIDDLILFRQSPRTSASSPAMDRDDRRLASACARYQEVGLEVKPSKVQDFSATQTILGYQLKDNVLQTSVEKYTILAEAVAALTQRGWAQPREVEQLVGKFTNAFLLHRPALAVFSSVYAFARKVGFRRARLWPGVERELRAAVAILPLVCSDLSRPTAPVLINADACDEGAAVVYTSAVDSDQLTAETSRPRRRPLPADAPWNVESAWRGLEGPRDPSSWRIGVRKRYSPLERKWHINEKETETVVTAVRWAARAPATRRCRLLLQTDSAVAVGACRKGRSSRFGLLRQCRRLAAVTLAFQISPEVQWIPTELNMADHPSRGGLAPGADGVAPVSAVRPRGRGQGGYAAERVGEAKEPGPPPPFWSPLLDGNVGSVTHRAYSSAVRRFVRFLQECDDDCETGADLDYWLAFYAHTAYVSGATSRGEVEKALYGVEHWLPECKPLVLTRRCSRGWSRLCPPRPAAPMPLDLVYACSAVAALGDNPGGALAILLAFDCWLRISEVASLTVSDVVDHRGQRDPIGRGVAVYLASTKTGRRQAVQVEDRDIAEMLVCWRDAVLLRHGEPSRRLFAAPPALRATLSRALASLAGGDWDVRGLTFVWHSLRHGGASRAYLAGRDWPDIMVRGRWVADSSGRRYVQAGRQLLLAIHLPAEVSAIAARVRQAGLIALLASDVRARLGP